MEVLYREHTITYNIIYSRRKTLTIVINQQGKVIVRSPVGLSKDRIEEIVLEKGSWILNKCNEIEKKLADSKKQYLDGELFLYRGEMYPLMIEVDEAVVRAHLIFQEKFLIITPVAHKDIYRTLLEKFYRKATRELVLKKVEHYKSIIGVEPNRIVIKQQKSRWGSCSSLGNLNFNWKLSMTSPLALDYVVVHEMCHLIHLNHSKAFWQLVEDILPHYREGKAWLKDNVHRLNLY